MLSLSGQILKLLPKRIFAVPSLNRNFFGKENKKGGKEQKKQQKPAQEQASEKLLPHQKMIQYFTPHQPGLSPSELQTLENKFSDIPFQQREMLDTLADKIVGLNTTMFYNFAFHREGLGTTEAYIVGSGELNDEQIAQGVKILRKDI